MKATPQEIETMRQTLRNNGIANYSINGLPEDESIARAVEEKYSFFFVCVKDPYYTMKAKSGNMRFRVFQTLKDKPQIPMGYSGSPLFPFECYDGEPLKMAISIIKSKVKNQYTYKTGNDDEITCIRVVPETEKTLKLVYVSEPVEGQEIFANWSNCYKQYKAKARVKTVNRASIRVVLTEEAGTKGDYGHYPISQEIVIKRPMTQQNCLTAV